MPATKPSRPNLKCTFATGLPKTPYKVCNGKELSNFLSQRVYKFDKEIPYCMD